ncbi:MAG: hypothetical protein ABSG61_13645 [Gemmatimonadales bacterium]
MKLIDTDDTILIVTGTEIPAEMNDRPLAYRLKAEIDRRGEGRAFRGAVVVSDAWFVQNRIFHLCSAVAVGGPGVNALAASLVEELPMLVRRDDRVFVQGKWDGEEKRASLWGMDRTATAQAVEVFLKEGHCDAFLNAAWKLVEAGGLPPLGRRPGLG